MKLYFCINKQPLNGYVNINLATQRVDFSNLNTLCEAAECTEMILDDVLEYLPLQTIPDILVKLITRLRKKGKIVIHNLDINETIKQYTNGLTSVADLNLMLYGHNQANKCSAFSHVDLHDILVTNGLQIVSIELLSNSFTIIAQRI